MEHRPCDRCGNQDAPFFDDEPNAPYCLDCLSDAMRRLILSVEWPDARVHPVIFPPLPVLLILAAAVVAILCVALILTFLH